ncbi:uncharacterized protein LOC117790342 [Drosophila innubila]|uniref:uncharacterized protein LOC117790342 n=1 Tax=Drosophila innubila TaxID=198719 RepID=UPI00148E72C8|nr:uncharacterized protein LOC117790342 [Drosophila innubila]
MVGPFMQGILLIGIIYWYSKSMMSMINDYYRSEFQRKIKTASDSKPTEETPLNVDNFMEYVRDLDSEHQAEKQSVDNGLNDILEPQLGISHIMLRFMQITGAYPTLDICGAQRTSADSSIS